MSPSTCANDPLFYDNSNDVTTTTQHYHHQQQQFMYNHSNASSDQTTVHATESTISTTVTLKNNDAALLDKVSLDDNDSNEKQQRPCYTEEQEKKLVRKMDMCIIPLLCSFYFVDFLDRANIGNATLAGLQTDLGMTGPELSTAISAFFVTYILFQVPSNIILKRLGARIWLSSIMLVWGLVTLSMALTTNFQGLLITRLLLGASESGFTPGILYQMSRIYKPEELGFRMAILLCMAAISGIASGPLAFLATSMDGLHGLRGWQYLFIIEGAPTVFLAVLGFLILFDSVEEVSWLTPEQKEVQRLRMLEVVDEAGTHSKPITLDTIKLAVMDRKTWLFASVFMLSSINVTSITVFSPVLIDGNDPQTFSLDFGFPALTAQLLTTPPCVVGAGLVLICGFFADRGNRRSLFIISGACIVGLGYLLLLCMRDRWLSYASIFVIAAGIGTEGPIGISWSALNYEDLTVRAVGVALVNMMGNIGSVIASYLYTLPGDTHHGSHFPWRNKDTNRHNTEKLTHRLVRFYSVRQRGQHWLCCGLCCDGIHDRILPSS
ncbi:major facilitator superfamily domain-containing protein [Dichotomocladium elegans]|nr:major facilitator superfamily domain-containing protein [Dichotomocladium elegans]